jgi:hypothetical protein
VENLKGRDHFGYIGIDGMMIKGEKFLDKMNDYQYLKKDSVSWG